MGSSAEPAQNCPAYGEGERADEEDEEGDSEGSEAEDRDDDFDLADWLDQWDLVYSDIDCDDEEDCIEMLMDECSSSDPEYCKEYWEDIFDEEYGSDDGFYSSD